MFITLIGRYEGSCEKDPSMKNWLSPTRFSVKKAEEMCKISETQKKDLIQLQEEK